MTKERDPKFLKQVLDFVRPLLQRVFRCKVCGIETLGEGPYLLVSNHNIGAMIEVLALFAAWETRYSKLKPLYALAHRFPFRMPGIGSLFKKFGAVPASADEAIRILQSGHSVVVFPGGNYEAVRPFTSRNLCDLGGRTGWAKIALASHVPVVPVSIVGSHSVNPIFVRSRFLASILVLPRVLGVKWFPISLSQIVYSSIAWLILAPIAPLWLVVLACIYVFLLTPLWPIWPARVRIRVGDPVDLSKLVTGDGPQALETCYLQITKRIQEGMDSMKGLTSPAQR